MSLAELWQDIHQRPPLFKHGDELMSPDQIGAPYPFYPSLLHAIQYNHEHHPRFVFAKWMDKSCKITDELSYETLWAKSALVADLLVSQGVQKGDRVMIAYSFGLEFLPGIIGCMRIGAIPCSVYPPNPTKGKAKFSYQQFNNQVGDASAKFALTTAKAKRVFQAAALRGYKANVTWLSTDNLKPGKKSCFDRAAPIAVQDEDIGLIQYSSGSMGTPKGVKLSHGAIVHQLASIARDLMQRHDDKAVGLSWLPQFHDYSLFAMHFNSLYCRALTIHFSPVDFIQNPLLWADAMETFGITHIAGPNFSYGLLAKRMKAKHRVLRKDATRLYYADVAAEPINPATLEAMIDIGIPQKCLHTSYGLAESCAYVTSCAAPELRVLEGVVSVGYLPRTEQSEKYLVIANERGEIVKDGVVDQVFVRGPDLASGYWAKPDLDGDFEVKLSDGHTYFATGDLGKIVEDRLYIMGRKKEVIITNGRNIYPHDIEQIIATCYPDVIRVGSTVAFQYTESTAGIVCEIRKTIKYNSVNDTFNPEKIRELVMRAHDIEVAKVDILVQGSVPKTTSGKLRRIETKQKAVHGLWKLHTEIIDSWVKDSNEEPMHHALPRNVVLNGLREDFLQLTGKSADAVPFHAIPPIVVSALRRIEMDEKLVNDLFHELQMGETEELVVEWEKADKSTRALQACIDECIRGLEENHPTLVQMFYLLQDHPEWIVVDNLTALAHEFVHNIFVINWATAFLTHNREVFTKKVRRDKAAEPQLTSHLEEVEVPEGARFLIDGRESDPLFKILGPFEWLKLRTLRHTVSEMVESMSVERVHRVLSLNILEVTYSEHRFGLLQNAWVGEQAEKWSKPTELDWSTDFLFARFQKEWMPNVYMTWVLTFALLQDYPTWAAGKLLVPTLLNAKHNELLWYRAVSLHSALPKLVALGASKTDHTKTNAKIISRKCAEAVGILNQIWFLEKVDRDHQMVHVNDDPRVQDQYRDFQEWTQPQANLRNPELGARDLKTMTEIMEEVIGCHYDRDQSWEEVGLTSVQQSELSWLVSEKLGKQLPLEFTSLYPTPRSLLEYIDSMQAQSFPVKLHDIDNPEEMVLPDGSLILLQSAGVLLKLVILAVSVLSAVFVGKQLSQFSSDQGSWMRWMWLPIALPSFFLVLSTITIALKWVVIGQYQERTVKVASTSYVRWWFIDRTVELWEFWTGAYILDTKFIWLFYRLMGASLSWSTRVDAFLREHDLISVYEGSEIGHSIRCRKFARWEGDHAIMRFRRITVGKNCSIEGHMFPGVQVGNESKVMKLSNVPEGARIPPNTIAKGSPAVDAGSYTPSAPSKKTEDSMLGIVKVVWLFLELYLFLALWVAGDFISRDVFPESWRYKQLFELLLILTITSMLSTLCSIAFKWILIGRRQPNVEPNVWRRMAHWVCDYHFRHSFRWLEILLVHTRILNMVLYLHGLDVDSSSYLTNLYAAFPPSKVDLIRIRRSFIPTMAFELNNNQRVDVVDSSLGHGAVLTGGTTVRGYVVPPRSYVETDLTGTEEGLRPSRAYFFSQEFLAHNSMVLPILLSFIPAYEFVQATIARSSLDDGFMVLYAIACTVAAIIVQCSVWIVMERTLVAIVYRGSKLRIPILFDVLVHVSYIFPRWSMIWLLNGTPMMKWYLQLMGAKINGVLWYFGCAVYDYPLLKLDGNAIVDDASLNGHYVVFGEIVAAESEVQGVVHPGTFVGAGAKLHDLEAGPGVALIGDVR